MRCFAHYTLLALPLLGGVVAEQPLAEASASIYANAHEAFQDLLNVLPEESLQAALNSLTKFKAGVFESHRRGVEHVHNSSPALATKLIVAAVQDLRKRQLPAPSNGTAPVQPSATPEQPPTPSSQGPVNSPSTTADAPATSNPATSNPPTSNPPETSANAPATTADAPATTANPPATAPNPPTTANTPRPPTSRPVLIPVEVTTVNQAGSTVTQTSQIFSEVTASISVTVIRATTNSRGSTVAVTTTEARPAIIRTTTDSRGSSIAVTSAAVYAPTRGQVLTTTDAAGSTLLTTYTPPAGRVSSIKLVTTTDAEGRPSTLTSYTYVDATDAINGGGSDGGGDAPAPTASGRPSVQSGAAHKNNLGFGAGVVGLGALAMFF